MVNSLLWGFAAWRNYLCQKDLLILLILTSNTTLLRAGLQQVTIPLTSSGAFCWIVLQYDLSTRWTSSFRTTHVKTCNAASMSSRDKSGRLQGPITMNNSHCAWRSLLISTKHSTRTRMRMYMFQRSPLHGAHHSSTRTAFTASTPNRQSPPINDTLYRHRCYLLHCIGLQGHNRIVEEHKACCLYQAKLSEAL